MNIRYFKTDKDSEFFAVLPNGSWFDEFHQERMFNYYQHTGQHGTCSQGYLDDIADFEVSADDCPELVSELKAIGYDIHS